jgi:hypothetical protein
MNILINWLKGNSVNIEEKIYVFPHGVDKIRKTIQEMRLCEVDHVYLKPDTLYLFTVDPECTACLEALDKATNGS